MDLSYTSYAPGTAVNEYQAKLDALATQRQADHAADMAAPAGTVATYSLDGRLPNWELLLHINKPQAWSTQSLRTALEHLNDPASMLTASTARVAAQTAAFEAELLTRN